MLSAKQRFHGHGSLRYVYKNSQAIRTRLFTVRSVTNPRRDTSRFSIVVSKKVHKSAVGRNRIRRRLYEIIRQDITPLQTISDVAVIVTSGEVLAASHDDLVKNLQEAFQQITPKKQ